MVYDSSDLKEIDNAHLLYYDYHCDNSNPQYQWRLRGCLDLFSIVYDDGGSGDIAI
jgi:hypothetical protein